MSLNTSRSPERAKRYRSREHTSYCNAPYPRERRSYSYLIERSNLCFQHAQFVFVFSRSYGTRKATWDEFLQPSLVLVYELRQDNLCNKCKRPRHFARDCPNIRVCNNCGLPGHIAAECNSTTMCWNCKEPGHLANQCSSGPVCHMCGNKGHLARDCSNPSLSSRDARLCNNCYKLGHIAVDCTNEKACNNCRKPNPLARDCPNEPVCHTSNISGHEAHHCAKSSLTPDIRGPFLDIMCRTCGMLGHICRECVSIVICNNCGGTVEGVTKPMSALKP